MEQFSMKELYDVSLKSTYPMKIGNRDIEIGEKIAVFDKIQLANFNEIKQFRSANGGYDNRARVIWDDTKEIRFNFTQGIFSKTQLALMLNSKLISSANDSQPILVEKREILEVNEEGKVELKHIPLGNIFIYLKENFNKINFEEKTENVLKINQPAYTEVVVDYQFEYKNKMEELIVGTQLTNGYLELEGKTRVKDDITGHTHTGIIKIPRLKLMSNLSMRLGENAGPLVGNFSAIGYPIGAKGNKKIMELFFLSDDIDSDM